MDNFYNSNCWGAALMAAGQAPVLEYLEAKSFHQAVNSADFRKLQKNEQPHQGDLIVFRDPRYTDSRTEVHAAVFISKNLWISKTDANPEFIRLQDPKEARCDYGPVYERFRAAYSDHKRLKELPELPWPNHPFCGA